MTGEGWGWAGLPCCLLQRLARCQHVSVCVSVCQCVSVCVSVCQCVSVCVCLAMYHLSMYVCVCGMGVQSLWRDAGADDEQLHGAVCTGLRMSTRLHHLDSRTHDLHRGVLQQRRCRDMSALPRRTVRRQRGADDRELQRAVSAGVLLPTGLQLVGGGAVSRGLRVRGWQRRRLDRVFAGHVQRGWCCDVFQLRCRL